MQMDDWFYQNKYLHIIPKNKFYSVMDKYVSSNESNSINDFIDHEVFKKWFIELKRNMKLNNGTLMREGDGELVTIDDRIIELWREFMKIQFFGEESSEKVSKRNKRKLLIEEEVIDGELPTMIQNYVNEKHKRAKISEQNILNDEDLPTEIELPQRELQYGTVNNKLIDSSDDDHKTGAENILNNSKSNKKAKSNAGKKKRDRKNDILKTNDVNDESVEIYEEKDIPESAFLSRKSAFRSNKNTDDAKSMSSSRFKKDPMQTINTVKTNEDDYMNLTMKNKQSKS